MESNKRVVSRGIKKLLRKIFKQHAAQTLLIQPLLQHPNKAESLDSLESLENCHNSNIEIESTCLESEENSINERLDFMESRENLELDFSEINAATVPVHFIQTAEGFFFWTAISDVPADNDLVEASTCSSYQQLACMQDRWAQA